MEPLPAAQPLSLDPVQPFPEVENNVALPVDTALRLLHLVDLPLDIGNPFVIAGPDPLMLLSRNLLASQVRRIQARPCDTGDGTAWCGSSSSAADNPLTTAAPVPCTAVCNRSGARMTSHASRRQN
ncbi:hypothetical protein [Pseudorhizobium flavum]|uniref:hypothetical protein n=1 Tax=Pseudorhizobium flavum TaxID=1335061 RepID=UPI0024925C95|nr:hypothetical protein [Pseudorhizobium flavum]